MARVKPQTTTRLRTIAEAARPRKLPPRHMATRTVTKQWQRGQTTVRGPAAEGKTQKTPLAKGESGQSVANVTMVSNLPGYRRQPQPRDTRQPKSVTSFPHPLMDNHRQRRHELVPTSTGKPLLDRRPHWMEAKLNGGDRAFDNVESNLTRPTRRRLYVSNGETPSP